jgi:hypothetical protein
MAKQNQPPLPFGVAPAHPSPPAIAVHYVPSHPLRGSLRPPATGWRLVAYGELAWPLYRGGHCSVWSSLRSPTGSPLLRPSHPLAVHSTRHPPPHPLSRFSSPASHWLASPSGVRCVHPFGFVAFMLRSPSWLAIARCCALRPKASPAGRLARAFVSLKAGQGQAARVGTLIPSSKLLLSTKG